MSAYKSSLSKSSAHWRTRRKEGQEENQSSTSPTPLKKNSQYRFGAYIRLSPSDEIRDEGSLISHPQRIKEFVNYKNQYEKEWGQIIDWYVDKDLSGKDLNRPAFLKMCKDIKDGKINAVIVTELSRLSRNVKDFCQFWDFLKEHRAKFFSLKENFDTSSPMGELMVVQAISFAQFERKSIIMRIKENSKARAKRGLWSGGPSPLGYDLDPNHRCHMMVNESEKATVEFIFRKFLELGTLRKLQSYLNENGYRTKQYTSKEGKKFGGKIWTLSSLYHSLTNMTYLGKREVNKRYRNVDPKKVPEGDDYSVTDAQWTALISQNLFDEVQELLEVNRKKTRRYVHHYRLLGLAWCGACGDNLVGKSGTGKNGKYFYYGHKRSQTTFNDRHLKRCTLESVSAPVLEEAVISRLELLANDRALLASLVRNSGDFAEKEKERLENLIASKEQERRQVEKTRDGLIQSLPEAPSEGSKKALLYKVEELTLLLEKIELEKEQFKASLELHKGKVVNLNEALKIVRKFGKAFKNMKTHEQSQILKEVIQKIVVNENGIQINYYVGTREDLGLPAPATHEFHKNFSDLEGWGTSGLGVRPLFKMVGQTGFEPATTRPPDVYATTAPLPD